MKEQRFFAFAYSPDGSAVLLGRVEKDTRAAATFRYFQMDLGETDPSWYAGGFYKSEKLAVETRERIGGAWITVGTTVYLCSKLQTAHKRVLNDKRHRNRRTTREMALEATRYAL